jgi:hypothetical protein
MIMKSILAATAVAATLFAVVPAAEANHRHKPHVNIDIGIGDPVYNPGYYDPSFDDPPPPRRRRPVYQSDYGYEDPVDYGDDYTISCGQGRQIMRHSGFRNVRTVECDGQNFKYTGYRRGASWIVMIDSRTGEIIRRNRY